MKQLQKLVFEGETIEYIQLNMENGYDVIELLKHEGVENIKKSICFAQMGHRDHYIDTIIFPDDLGEFMELRIWDYLVLTSDGDFYIYDSKEFQQEYKIKGK